MKRTHYSDVILYLFGVSFSDKIICFFRCLIVLFSQKKSLICLLISKIIITFATEN